MKLQELNYDLPEELIAQRPVSDRGGSRMLVLDRKSGRWDHKFFRDLPDYLQPSDYLVLNQSKVIKARLLGVRDTGGRVEIFLLRQVAPEKYECLVRLTAPNKEGVEFRVGSSIRGRIASQIDGSSRFIVEMSSSVGSLDLAIEREGRVPLPPYINRDSDLLDVEQYQTVYAAMPGSVAAPTAGLHFTQQTLRELEQNGVRVRRLTLHVGIGTFQPIKVERLEDHKMHREFFEIDKALLEECSRAHAEARRIVAVGTTTVRALESAARGIYGSTDIFLKPGAHFHWVNALLTNFHQPRSSLLALMCAFVGDRNLLLSAYQDAIKERYRFFSYGDCMLVL